MDTSESAIFHGLEMSRKAWAYQFGCGGDRGTQENFVRASRWKVAAELVEQCEQFGGFLLQ
ncbi:hypothetical protein A7D17_16945 [Xanthomonas floridensis]|uniref:Uncharacterized protein n=1 Tax=Xanthomonas floridensis TaxID=1843580 RepID=A0A1A9MBA5_9XANT|nr:hypothetical protein A7D17_16945 [Xanthomonas floridensis]